MPAVSRRVLLVFALFVCACVGVSAPAGGATAGSVVGANVLSATSLDSSGCRSGVAGSTMFPSIAANTGSIGTADCTISFSSSNDTARIELSQGDGAGATLANMATTNTRLQDDVRMYDVDAFSTTIAWATGTQGTIRKWDGAAWNLQPAGTTNTFRGVAVGSTNQVAWVAGANANIRGTANAGSTWPLQHSGTGTLQGIDAWNDSIAAAVGDGGMGVYTANGSTWNASTTNTTDTLQDVLAISATVIVAVGDNGRIVRSTDGGATYTPVASGTAATLNSITARDASTLYAAGASVILKSGDAGLTWAPLAGVPTFGYEAIVAEGALNIVAFTGYGQLVRSTNDGGSWTTMETGYHNDLQGAALSGTRTFIAGYGSELGYSDDIGTSWTMSPLFRASLYGVYATSRNRAWSVGARGTIRATTDGATMVDQTSGTTQLLRDVDGAGSTHVWAVGNAGTIRATIDGGANWAGQTSGVSWDIRGVDAVTEHVVWAVGSSNPRAIRTINGGATWQETTLPAASLLYSVSAANEHVAWASGSSAYLARTLNGGQTWTQIALPGVFATQTVRVSAAEPTGQRLVALGSGGSLYRTVDGGTSWTPVAGADGIITSGNGIDAHDTNAMAIAASGGAVYYSGDGVTWITGAGGSPTRSNNDVSFPSTQSVWSAADSYALLRTSAATASIPDFTNDPGDTSGNDWGTPGAAMFGGCLRALGSATALDWAVDANADCTAVDTDPWRPIVTTPGAAGSPVARTTTAGATGVASIRFGLRTGTSPAGNYAGSIRIDVIAPG